MRRFYRVTHLQMHTPDYISTLGVLAEKGQEMEVRGQDPDEETMVQLLIMGMSRGKFSNATAAQSKTILMAQKNQLLLGQVFSAPQLMATRR